jgi:serine phosphatase RsbU (regulator of sigma subunit)
LKKRHLSQIVLAQTAVTIMGLFTTLMIITVFFIYLYAKSRTEDFVRYSLQSINSIVQSRMDYNLKNSTIMTADYYDGLIAENGPDYPGSAELNEEMWESVEYDIYSEQDIVDHNGIIISSSDDANIGYDMSSNPGSAEFMCLLDGGTDVMIRDMEPRDPDGTVMKYCGAPLREYGGFLFLGFNTEEYDIYKDKSIDMQIENSKVGRNGYYLRVNGEGTIESCTDAGLIGKKAELPREVRFLAGSGRVIQGDVYGVKSYVGAVADGDDYIVSVYPAFEAWETWNVLMVAILVIYAVVLTILFLMIRRLMTGQILQGVYSINGSLGRITEGDLDEKADFRNSIEFDELSDGINQTVDRLKKLIKEAEGRIDAELALAAKIQAAFLPHEFPAFPDREEFELYADMTPAKEVGGDFYDFFLVDQDHLALVMADVSGKGLPAALFMAASKDKIRHSVMKHGTDVAEAMREVNTNLIKENEAKLFVTVWLGVFTISTGHMDYVDAGHEYPAISRGGEEFIAEEDVHSAPVAARKKTIFEAGSFEMRPGDILYLYTDGVTEANDPEGKMFQRSGMLDALNRYRSGDSSVEDIDAGVREAIAGFAGEAPQFDDTTTLVFRYRGTGS